MAAAIKETFTAEPFHTFKSEMIELEQTIDFFKYETAYLFMLVHRIKNKHPKSEVSEDCLIDFSETRLEDLKADLISNRTWMINARITFNVDYHKIYQGLQNKVRTADLEFRTLKMKVFEWARIYW